MGNWRTVDMTGHIDKNDVEDIRSFLAADSVDHDVLCLAIDCSMCGLNNWIDDSGDIDVCGNLYERDFDNEDIEKALTVLAKRYKRLTLTLHSGSDWESRVCSATFHVQDGAVIRRAPEVESIRECRCLSVEQYFRMVAAQKMT